MALGKGHGAGEKGHGAMLKLARGNTKNVKAEKDTEEIWIKMK